MGGGASGGGGVLGRVRTLKTKDISNNNMITIIHKISGHRK